MAMVCAAALVCVAAGCVSQSFLAPWGSAPLERWVVNEYYGSLGAALETGLSDQGIRIVPKRLADEVRLAGQTRSGKVFCLYIKPAPDDREKATVALRWDREADEVFRKMVVELLKPPAKDREDVAVPMTTESTSSQPDR
jgi:hypothetical protein